RYSCKFVSPSPSGSAFATPFVGPPKWSCSHQSGKPSPSVSRIANWTLEATDHTSLALHVESMLASTTLVMVTSCAEMPTAVHSMEKAVSPAGCATAFVVLNPTTRVCPDANEEASAKVFPANEESAGVV